MFDSRKISGSSLVGETHCVHYAVNELGAPKSCFSGTLVGCSVIVVTYVELRSNLTRVLFAHAAGSELTKDMVTQLELIAEIMDKNRLKVACCHNGETRDFNIELCKQVGAILDAEIVIAAKACNAILQTSTLLLIPEGSEKESIAMRV